MLFLLAKVAEPTGAPIKISTVLGKLSGIRVSLAQAGVEFKEWDDAALTMVRHELATRQRLGTEKKLEKLPILPRLIMFLDTQLALPAWQLPCNETASNYNFLVAAMMVYLAYFFGWRDETASSLRWSHLHWDAEACTLTVAEEFAKGHFGRAR